MAKGDSWQIVHAELGQAPTRSCLVPGTAGIYVVYWYHDAPVAHSFMAVPDVGNAMDQFTVKQAVLAVDGSEAVVRDRASSQPDPEDMAGVRRAAAATVVVCTRDRPEQLGRCLRSLLGQSAAPGEIVVVDNAPSSDATRELVDQMVGIRYVVERRPGLDVARNTGIARSSGQFIAFTDDDAVVHPRWLVRLLGGFERPEIAATTGIVLPQELETEAQLLFETCWSFNKGFVPREFAATFFQNTRRLGCPTWEIGAGANMAFRRDVFERLGGFDERLDVGAAGCSGDSEMWYRVLANGWACRYEPSAVVFHQHRRDTVALNRQIFAYMRGHASALLIQFERYRHWGNLRRVFLTLPAYYGRLLVRRLRHGPELRTATLGYEVAGYVAGIGFYLRHMRMRRSPGPVIARNVEIRP
jgi:glycosyltransferase involved in cell wall biosynthesis